MGEEENIMLNFYDLGILINYLDLVYTGMYHLTELDLLISKIKIKKVQNDFNIESETFLIEDISTESEGDKRIRRQLIPLNTLWLSSEKNFLEYYGFYNIISEIRLLENSLNYIKENTLKEDISGKLLLEDHDNNYENISLIVKTTRSLFKELVNFLHLVGLVFPGVTSTDKNTDLEQLYPRNIILNDFYYLLDLLLSDNGNASNETSDELLKLSIIHLILLVISLKKYKRTLKESQNSDLEYNIINKLWSNKQIIESLSNRINKALKNSNLINDLSKVINNFKMRKYDYKKIIIFVQKFKIRSIKNSFIRIKRLSESVNALLKLIKCKNQEIIIATNREMKDDYDVPNELRKILNEKFKISNLMIKMEDEIINEIRNIQKIEKILIVVYGDYAKYRFLRFIKSISELNNVKADLLIVPESYIFLNDKLEPKIKRLWGSYENDFCKRIFEEIDKYSKKDDFFNIFSPLFFDNLT